VRDVCFGGPLLLLSVWSWKRFPVGQPKLFPDKDYLDENNPDKNNPFRLPTWAYQWDVVSEFTSDPQAAYQAYTNEFDNLVPKQVQISIPSLFLVSGLSDFYRLYCCMV
jgi:hypothetical protein